MDYRLSVADLDRARAKRTKRAAMKEVGQILLERFGVAREGVTIKVAVESAAELRIEAEESDDLVYVFATGMPPAMTIHGWIKGMNAKVDAFERDGAFVVPRTVLRAFDTLEGFAPPVTRSKQRPPCHYEDHVPWWWRLPDPNPYTDQEPDRWQCGICHPPPFPGVWTITSPGAEDQRLYIVWRDMPPQVVVGPSEPRRSVAR
jgi:hypothetical protein